MSSAREPERIQEEIEQTRAELGDTVEALAQKADVKAQVKRKVQETIASVAEGIGKATEVSPDTAVSTVSGVSRKAQAKPPAACCAGRVRRRLPGRAAQQALIAG
jgi:hypothetical protein